jgi:hypothetical protein
LETLNELLSPYSHRSSDSDGSQAPQSVDVLIRELKHVTSILTELIELSPSELLDTPFIKFLPKTRSMKTIAHAETFNTQHHAGTTRRVQ